MSSSEAPKLGGENLGGGINSNNAEARKVIAAMGRDANAVLRLINWSNKRARAKAKRKRRRACRVIVFLLILNNVLGVL